MSDATDADASEDASSLPDRDRDWYAQQWRRLCDEVEATDPTEVLARVQALKREVNQSSPTDDEGLVTVSEVEEVFREMNQKMDKLRERNAALVDRLNEEDDIEEPFHDLHQKAEQLLDTLDAASMEEARRRIRKLNERLDALYREKETLAQAGLSDAEAALAELDRLRGERDALQEERDRLRSNLNRLEEELAAAQETADPASRELASVIEDQLGIADPEQVDAFAELIDDLHERVREASSAAASDPEPDDGIEKLRSVSTHLDSLPAPDALPPEVGEVLGIRTAEDARELESLIADLSDRLDRFDQELSTLDEANLTADAALTMIENMEAQLADLYHGSPPSSEISSASPNGLAALSPDLRRRVFSVLDADPDDLEGLQPTVRRLTERLDRLSDAQAALAEAGLDANEALTMIESMKVQLNDLYRGRDETLDAAQRLAAIEDVLGISTREEAEELSQIARQMEEQLTAVYQEKEKLEKLGLSSIEDAVAMIENMENQLTDLYEDKEALRDVRVGTPDEQQSTFQQLEALYAERERLQQALGVSSASDVIELVESLTTQVNELYKGLDADLDPQERREARLWEPSPDDADTSPSASETPGEDVPTQDDTALTLNSMEHQLESLYREKEALLHHGLSSAQEAVSKLQTQQKQLDVLLRENHAYQQRLDRLQSSLGTANVSEIVDLVQALQSEADVSIDEVRPAPTPEAESEYGPDIEAASPFVDADTLNQLGDLGPEALNDLDAGAVRLSDEGTVEALNEAALQLPGLSDVDDPAAAVGKNFFRELAPSTNNNLFYGRFQKGKRRGSLDARFPYTFTSPDDEAHPFQVHLYRPPHGESTWLLYRPA